MNNYQTKIDWNSQLFKKVCITQQLLALSKQPMMIIMYHFIQGSLHFNIQRHAFTSQHLQNTILNIETPYIRLKIKNESLQKRTGRPCSLTIVDEFFLVLVCDYQKILHFDFNYHSLQYHEYSLLGSTFYIIN